jgi:hypothetical protein
VGIKKNKRVPYVEEWLLKEAEAGPIVVALTLNKVNKGIENSIPRACASCENQQREDA